MCLNHLNCAAINLAMVHENERNVVLPERTTTSLVSRPFDVNLAMILSRGSNGDGKLTFAAFMLAVNPSLRPNETCQ